MTSIRKWDESKPKPKKKHKHYTPVDVAKKRKRYYAKFEAVVDALIAEAVDQYRIEPREPINLLLARKQAAENARAVARANAAAKKKKKAAGGRGRRQTGY